MVSTSLYFQVVDLIRRFFVSSGTITTPGEKKKKKTEEKKRTYTLMHVK